MARHNAVLKAIDTFRTIETLPFSRESSICSIARRSISGGSRAATRSTRSRPLRDGGRRPYLPGQDAREILAQVRQIPDIEVERTFIHPSVGVSRHNPYVHALSEAVARATRGEVMSVGRDGASDAASFIEAGIPAVEFGPAGGGHHGPDEWVSLQSLASYRQALTGFVRGLPDWLARSQAGPTAGRRRA